MKPTYGESCDLNTKFTTIGERLRPKLVKFTPQLEVDYTL